jgi:hypothetical protein
MKENNREGIFFLGGMLLVAGLCSALYVFLQLHFEGRIRLWMFPLLAFTSDVAWHGPVATGGLVAAFLGYRIARRADAGLPFWAQSSQNNSGPKLDRIVTPSPDDLLKAIEIVSIKVLEEDGVDHTLFYPSRELAGIVGATAQTRLAVVKKVWQYIKDHDLQSQSKPDEIITDRKLSAVVGDKKSVSLFDLTRIISTHLQTSSSKRQNNDESIA